MRFDCLAHVRIPGVVRNFANTSEFGAKQVGQRLQCTGVFLGVGAAVARRFGNRSVLVRHHCHDLFDHRSGQRVLERESRSLVLRFLTEVSVNGAFEKGGAFRNTRHFLVDNQRCRPIDAINRLHRELAQMCCPAVLPPAFESGGGAANAEPVGDPPGLPGSGGRQRQIRRQYIIGGDCAGDKAIVEKGIE